MKLRSLLYKLPKLWCGAGNYARTYAVKHARKKGVKVGEGCRLYSPNFSSEEYLIEIGDHVTITSGVQFVTHDGGAWVLRGLKEEYKHINILGKIILGDNVFVGKNCIFLPGVEVGDNVIIAAGSVITKSIPSNSIAAGVPAKVIKDIDAYIEMNKKYFVNTLQYSSDEKRDFIMNEMSNDKFRIR